MRKLSQQGGDQFQKLLGKMEDRPFCTRMFKHIVTIWKSFESTLSRCAQQDAAEQKSYDLCLKHADELQELVHTWGDREILTRTQLEEAQLAIPKAGLE